MSSERKKKYQWTDEKEMKKNIDLFQTPIYKMYM